MLYTGPLTQQRLLISFQLILFPFSGLYLASYESESPENQVEKDRWKALRYVRHLN